ncbi:MAG: recombinase family protein [Clostridia bacterium]|nr:recombinase family protein [Clostridia bacterium]
MDSQQIIVDCLYRVSSKIQVDKDDIPMQRKACHEFIEKQPNWVLGMEHYEKGVSGYKVSSDKRDILQQVRERAEKKKFHVLLVFMFDRLGRREDETPFIVEWFHKKGIQIWSTKEGEQRFDSRVDKLLNYIRYWQSGGESEKTGIRVNEKHTQMVKEGLYRGGVPPYGYRLIKSGVENRKGKELVKLAIDEEESKTVKTIYSLAYEQGYGGYRIAKYLNEHGISPRKGTSWGLAVTNYILRNPIYKGYQTYGKTTCKGDAKGRVKPSEWVISLKPSEELVIIPEHIWEEVQRIRRVRTPKCYREENLDYNNYPMQTKSPLLLVGQVKCGRCRSALTTAYHKNTWENKDGTIKEKSKPVYRCSGRAAGKVDCNGQVTYSKAKIEGIVLDEIYQYLDQLNQVDLSEKIEKKKLNNINEEKREYKIKKKKLDECTTELAALNSEVPKCILGKSEFSRDLLSELIDTKTKEINELEAQIKILDSIMEAKIVEINDMVRLKKKIPVWKVEFEKAELEKKKMMLAQIIDEITVWPDRVDIKVKMYINEFISGIKNKNFMELIYSNGGFIGLETRNKPE